MNKFISNSIIACFLIYTLFLSNFAFVAGENILDNNSVANKIKNNVSNLDKNLENLTNESSNSVILENDSDYELNESLEENKTLKDNFTNKDEIIEGNYTSERNDSFVSNISEEILLNDSDYELNESLEENKTLKDNFTNKDEIIEGNYTSERNDSFVNISKEKSLIESNISENNISKNESDYDVEIIQLPAKVGESVRWIKRVYGVPENFEIEIPRGAQKVLNDSKEFSLMNSFSKEKNYTEVIYETSAPLMEEKKFENKKEVLVYSENHYENVTVNSNLDFNLSVNESDKLNIYWKEEKKYLDFEILDLNLDGYVDSVEWIIPHLSNQTFEIFIDVLTVQSYPIVGGEWEVEFETSGIANLSIKGINGTFFGEDLEFLELKCGGEEIEYSLLENGIFVENYSCGDSSFEISKVLTSGKHDLEFRFGDSVDYAHNFAGKVGYKTQSGIYNFAGLDEFIPLDFSVNTSSAFVIAPNLMNQENTTPGTRGDPSTNSDDSFVSLYLYNSTHIRVQRSASDDGPVVVTWQVLEAMNGEFSVQRGSHYYSGSSTMTSADLAEEVNKDNSLSWFYINTTYTSNDGDKIQFYSDLIDNDTLQFTREHSGVSTDVSFRWIVVEWNQSKINNFLKGYTGPITGSSDSPDCFSLDSTINKSSSILLHQSHAINDGDGGLDSSTRGGYIQDNNNICFYDYDGSFNAGVKWYLIDFVGVTGREEDIQTDWGSEDYRDDVSFLTNYNKNNSLFWLSATSNGDGTAKPRHTQWWEFNSTSFNVQRTYGGQNREYSWQILELPYYENLDVPQFSNAGVNESYAGSNQFVRFSIDIFDNSNSIDVVNGTIDGNNVSFVQGTGDEWHYDYQCVNEKDVNFSFIYASDDGYPVGTNSTGVFGVGVVCDLTSPVVNFASPHTPANDSSQGDNYFAINVSLIEDNFENITYNLFDSNSLVNSTGYSNLIDSIVFSNLPTENYFYNVTVYDKAGNFDSTEIRKIYIDSENPSIKYNANTLESGEVIPGDTISIEVDVVEDNEANITYFLYDEFGSLERTPVPYTDGRRSISWSLLSDGLYFYNVTVYDSFGHFNFTETRNVTLDNVVPFVEYGEGVEDNDSYFSRDWIFVNVSYSEEHYKNISFNLYNQSGLVENSFFTDGSSYYNFTNLGDSEYLYNVSVCDQADNCGSTNTYYLNLDNVNPFVDFGLGTEQDNNNVSQNWIYVNSSIVEENFENITFELFNEYGLFNKTTYFSNFDINFTGLSTDFYDYNFTVYDKAGNFNKSDTRTIGVDVSGPDITINSPLSKAYGNGTDMDLTYSVIDSIAGADSCWYNIDGGSNQSVDCEGSSSFTVSDGSHSLHFYSNDSFGNLGFDEVNFLVSTTGPAVTLNEPENDTFYSTSTNTFFNYSVSDLDGVKSCSLLGDFNGTWLINQTDFTFGEIWNESDMDCSSSTSVSCGEPESGTPFDGCDSSYSTAYEYVSGVQLSDTVALTSSEVTVNCEFVLDGSNDDIYIWHYDGNVWEELKSEIGTTTTTHEVSFNVGENVGNHVVRCGITYYDDTSNDFCANGGGNYYDNDDLNFSVVEPKEEGNFTVDLTGEGNYDWNVECKDSLDYVGTALNNFSLGIDLTNPVVDFGRGTLESGSRTSSNNIYLNASVVENNFENITFSLFDFDNNSIDSQSYFDETRNHTFVGVDDGIYYYNFSVYDKSGRVGSSETRKIELDLSSPSGNLISPEDEIFTKNSEHNLTVSVEDSLELKDATLFIFNSTGQLVYSYLVDLAGLTSATIGIVYNFLYDGVFDWFYRVRDSVNNEYNTTSNSVEIDSTSPTINFISPTEENGNIVLRDWIFVNVSVYEKNYKNLTFWLHDEGGLVSPSPNSFSDDTRSVNWTFLPEGSYEYNVSSFDLAGNEGFSETREIVLDTTNPIVSFGGITKEDDFYTTGNSLSVEVEVTEPNEKNITFSRFGESSVKSSFVDGRRTITWNFLDDGIYYYNVTVFDQVDLKGFTDTRKITLDNVEPVISFGVGTEENNSNKSQNWIFINASVEEENFDNISFRLYNESGVVDVFNSELDLEYNFTDLNDGKYYYNFTAFDKAGQNSNSETRKITLDTVEPIISFVSPTEDDLVIRNRDWVYVNASVVEDNFKEIKFSLYDGSGLGDEQLFSDSTREYNFTGLVDGNYEYNVTVYDWAGNENYTGTRHIGLDGAGPEVNIIKPKSKTYGYNESLLLEHEVSDRVSSLDICWWNIDGGQNQTINCNEDTTFNTTVDSHKINFYANDSFGNLGHDSVSFFISVTGPVVELVLPENDTFYSSATEINFSFAANDPDSVDACSLYGDWGTGWQKNETYSGSWYDVGFKHRKDVDISNPGTSNLVDFPIYLNISSDYTSSGDYYDLRFFNGSCSEEQTVSLPYDVEYYDINSADVWVRVPEISSSGSTICMYYGGDGAEEKENVSGVWNSDYGLVYDMQIGGNDLTFNSNDIAAVIGNPIEDNSFGYGISFSSGNAWDMTNVAYWETQWATRTHEVIFKTNSNVNTRQVLLAEGGGTNGYMMYILNGYLYARWWSESTGFNGDYISVPIQGGEIYHAVSSFEYPGNYTFYLDGELIDNRISPSEISSHSGDGGIGYTGSTNKDFHDVTDGGNYFLGTIYDIKVSDVYRDTNWVNETYSSIFESESIANYLSEENFTAFSIPISEEGSYIWNVECNDTIGYDSFGLNNYTFIMDVTNPEIFFGSGTDENDTTVGRNWIYVDTNVIENNFENISFDLFDSSGLVESESYLDSTREHNFTNLDSGFYFYNITVYDKAGRDGSSETRLINLDLNSPTGELDSPPSGSYLKNLVQNLTGTFSDPSGLLNATVYVFNETGHLIFSSFKSLGGLTLATIGFVYNFIQEGIYSWFYEVEDVVGNVYFTENNTLTIDTTKPLIEYSFGTEQSGLVFEREHIFVNVTFDDIYFSNLTFNLYDKNGFVSPSPNTFSDGTSEINWTTLGDGTYYYNVSVADLAGNENMTETRNLTLDNLDPIIGFGEGTLENGAYDNGDEIFVNVTVDEANEENITFNLFDEYGSNVRSNTFSDQRRSLNWNLIGDGIYYYNVTVYDKVGHFDSTQTRKIILDNIFPKIEYSSGTEEDGEVFSRDWIYFEVNIDEDNFKNISLSLYNSSGLISTQSFSGTTRSYNWTELDDGNYWYNATTYDKAGNKNNTETRNIVLDNIYPLIEYSSGTEVDDYNKIEDWIFVNVSVVEDNFENITFDLFDSEGIVDSEIFYGGTRENNFTGLDSKVYWYNVTVFDSAGNKNFTETRKIGIDYLGPSINLINPKSKAYGYNISLPLEYSVSDNIIGEDSCWYNLDLGSNVSVDCSLESTTFNTSDGGHTLHFYANDSFGNLNYENITFLVSTTGPAIQLFDPEDDSFYSEGAEIFFNYTAEDPDVTQACSLYGSWNGGWHLNQTDSDWDKRDSSSRTCSEVWGFDCGAGPPESGDNTFDDCSNGAGNDESVENIYLSDTSVIPGQEMEVTCEFDPYTSDDDLFIWYYNGTGWEKLYEEYNMGSSVIINRSVSFVVDEIIGEHWVRCGIIYQGSGTDDQCTDETTYGSDYFDNDDLNFTVIEPKTDGNFTLNLSEEGTHEWNIECNDSLGYYTWAVDNYSITFDVTDPLVDFGLGTLGNNSNVSQNWIYVNSSIVENNFKNISFGLFDSLGFVEGVSFNDSTRDYNFTEITDGIYYYNITVHDKANRKGISSTREITLDTELPLGNLVSPSDNSFVNNSTQNLTATLSDNRGLKEAILFIFNSTGLVYKSTPISLTGLTVATVGLVYEFLQDGIFDWFYQVEDSVGNQYNLTNYSLIVDTALPKIIFEGGTAEKGSYLSQDFVYVNVSLIEDNFKNITFELYDESSRIYSNTFTNSKRDINWTLLDDGIYYYNVAVWDKAGNFNFSETRNMTLDNVLPVASYSFGTEEDFANKSQNWIFVNVSVVEDNFDNIRFRLYNDEGLLDETVFYNSTREINWTDFVSMQDEDYYYNVTVYDKAGLKKDLPTRKISLDTIDPLVDFASGTAEDGGVFEREWIYVSSSVVETNFKNMSYRLYDNNSQLINETSFDSLVSEVNFTASGENNTHYYEIVVYDWAGNYGASDIRNITLIDITNPSLVLTSPENATYPYADGIRLDYEVSDVHLDSCWYSLDGGTNISLPNCQGIALNVEDEMSHSIDLFVNDTLGYMNSSSVVFFVNSSLIETPTYKVIRGNNFFVDGVQDVSIDVIDMSKSFILYNSRGTSSSAPNNLQVIGRFTSSTNLQFENYETGIDSIVDWSLVSGPGISVQRGEISFTNENNLTASINSVNLSNSFIIVDSKLNSSDPSDNVEGFFSGRFADDSNLVFERGAGSAEGVLSWQVVSWEGINVQGGDLVLDSVQNKGSFIDEVRLNNSFLIFSHSLVEDDSVEDVFVEGVIENSTYLNFTRRGNGGKINLSYFVISSDFFDVQRGEYEHLLTGNKQLIYLDYDLKNEERSFDLGSHENSGTSTDFLKGFVTQNIEDNDSLRLQKGLESSGESSWFAVEILDVTNPVINLTSPINDYNYTSHGVGGFSFIIEDESNMSNCSLYGSWNGWHINQTIYGVNSEIENSFNPVEVGESGFYNWSVECYDIYGNSYLTENRTFSSYLPPSEPEFVNVSQTANDGTGSVFLNWKESNETVKYRIYYSDNMGDFVLLNETFDSNYTDVGFSGAKRRFYKVEAWNPSASNLSDYTFGAHVYELKHNLSSEHPIKNRNWMGFPTNFSYLNSASDALEEINGIVSIGRLDTSTQKKVTCTEFSCPESFGCTETACNFDLKAGEGYEVLLNESGPSGINWSGVGVVNEAIQVNLVYDETGIRFNKNWISMYAGTVLEDSSDLADSLLGEDAITSWNVDEQESEGFSRTWVSKPWYTGWLEFGEGFEIEPEKGYEVSVTQDSVWTQE